MTVEGSGEQRVCYGTGGGTPPLNDQDFLSVTSLLTDGISPHQQSIFHKL